MSYRCPSRSLGDRTDARTREIVPTDFTAVVNSGRRGGGGSVTVELSWMSPRRRAANGDGRKSRLVTAATVVITKNDTEHNNNTNNITLETGRRQKRLVIKKSRVQIQNTKN